MPSITAAAKPKTRIVAIWLTAIVRDILKYPYCAAYVSPQH
jgi:hypothetical protein